MMKRLTISILAVAGVFLLGQVTSDWPASKVSFSPDTATEWIVAPTTVDGALEGLADQAHVYNVKSFGAACDAVAAACDFTVNPPACTDTGTGTDDTAAFAAAYDAAEAAGGKGTIFIPKGACRALIKHDVDNVGLKGERGSIVYPPLDQNDGGWIVEVCKRSGGVCDSATSILDPVIDGICFQDDFPDFHGHARYSVVQEALGLTVSLSGTIAGTPAYENHDATVPGAVKANDATHGLSTNDWIMIATAGSGYYAGRHKVTVIDVDSFYFDAPWLGDDQTDQTWTATPGFGDTITFPGSGTARIVGYQPTTGIARVYVLDGEDPEDGEDLTNADRYVIENVSTTSCDECGLATTDNMNGILVSRAIRPRIKNACATNIGGHGVKLDSGSAADPTTEAIVSDLTLTNIPASPSGSSGIFVDAAEHSIIEFARAPTGGVQDYTLTVGESLNSLIRVTEQADYTTFANYQGTDDDLSDEQIQLGVDLDVASGSTLEGLIFEGGWIKVHPADYTSTYGAFKSTQTTTGVAHLTIRNFGTRSRFNLAFAAGSSVKIEAMDHACDKLQLYGFSNMKGGRFSFSQVNIDDCRKGALQFPGDGGITSQINMEDVTITNSGGGLTSNLPLINIASTALTKLEISGTKIYGVTATGANVSAIDCNGKGNATVTKPYIDHADYDGIVDCKNVSGAEIIHPGNDGISNTGVAYGSLIDNKISEATNDCIEIGNGSNHTTAALNKCISAAGAAIRTSGTVDYLQILGNNSVDGSDFLIFAGAESEDKCKTGGSGATAANTVCANNIDFGE